MTEYEPPRLCILGMATEWPRESVATDSIIKDYNLEAQRPSLELIGIKERRVAKIERISELGIFAARKALERAAVKPEDLEFILAHSTTPEGTMPTLANQIQYGLTGEKATPARYYCTACSGFNYGINDAQGQIALGYSPVLVVLAEKFQPFFGPTTPPDLRVIGSDGATAAVFGKDDGNHPVVLRNYVNSKHSTCISLNSRPGSGPGTADYGYMDGGIVSRLAVMAATETAQKLLCDNPITLDGKPITVESFDHFVLHQANNKLIGKASEKLGIPKDKVYMNIETKGNCGAVSAAACLSELSEGNDGKKLKAGDLVMLLTFGAGFSWGGSIIEWR